MNNDAAPSAPVTRSDARGRYELEHDGAVVAFAEFSDHGDIILIPYIETDPRHRGHGHSSTLMDGVIADVRARQIKVRATCAVARAHIAGHAPELLVN